MSKELVRNALAAVALGGLILVTIAGCGGGGGGGGAGGPAVAAGEKVFMQICATCHGQDANGLPNLGKGLRSNAFVKDHNDAELVDFIKVGRPAKDPLNSTGVDMPPKGGNPALSEEDIANVVAYLRTL